MSNPDYCPGCGEKGKYEDRDAAQGDIRTCSNDTCRVCFYLDIDLKQQKEVEH